MINVNYSSTDTEQQDVNTAEPEVSIEEVRAAFEEHIHISHDITGLLSRAEVQSLRQYVNSVLSNPQPDKLRELAESYTGSFAEQSKAEALNSYHNNVIAPLKTALDANVISATSYREWIDWIRDPDRDATDKKPSITNTLPDYLEKRYALASKRSTVLRDSRFEGLENSSDPKLKSLAAKLSDSDYFLDTLSFEERKSLIVDVLSTLPIVDSQKTLFAGFEKDLDAAVKDGLISADSKKKWIARFNDPSVTPRAKEYFVQSQFPSYVTAWKKVHKERENIRKDPAFAELSDTEFKNLGIFKEDSKFLGLHFDSKTGMVAEAKAAIKAHTEGKLQLHNDTKNALQAAAAAGYISTYKIGAWTEHVLSGERTLNEMKLFIKDWAKVRHRYDKIEMKMLKGRVPQGLQRLSEEKFLGLSYSQRLSYVEEAERRLHIEVNDPKDTPIQDAKGKVRHALDLENWDEAQYFMARAWPLAQTAEDIAELQSMQKHLKAFSKKGDVEKNREEADADVQWAREEIESVMEQLPPSYQKLYSKALKTGGSSCLQCVTTCVSNRTWCEERGYDRFGAQDRKKSIEETAHRLSHTGGGHDDGYENNFVDGFNKPSIRNKGIGPQNVFSSSTGVDSFVQQANANKNTWSFWYWTNYIDKDVSASQNSYVSYSLNHRIKRAARTLDKHGASYKGPMVKPAGSTSYSLSA